jgi:hypothetical protein
MMQKTPHAHSGRGAVTVVRWERRPGDNPLIRFLTFSVLGLILGLILMVFMPGLTSFGAMVLFTAVFAAILTIPTIASQKSFMRGLTQRINDTIREVSSASIDQLSTRQLGQLAKTGQPLPLLVNGVPGLRLQVKRVATVARDAPHKWLAEITVLPPKNGVASFDRLLAAVLASGATEKRDHH